MRRESFISSLIELTGCKTGLALNRADLHRIIGNDQQLFGGPDEEPIRVHSSVVDEWFTELLYSAGHLRDGEVSPTELLQLSLQNNPNLLEAFRTIELNRSAFFVEAMGDEKFDLEPFRKWCIASFPDDGERLCKPFIEEMRQWRHRSPFFMWSAVPWDDTAELSALFESENLQTQYGSFFDQRFADYLAANFDSIDAINWRQFEGLTCEYFHREGFEVAIGPGRDDDNVDARVWPKGASDRPPLIVVQCKRQATKIDKVVVKALYADILHEDAKSGLIVTTSALSPGAAKVCEARAYPIEQANRATVREWLEKLRTPNTGY